MQESKDLALALSGGGIRAMLFHLGVLKCLAERSSMERVQRISTVSGGSLLVGLIMQENSLRWPTSPEYLERILPALLGKFTSRSLQWGAARQLRPWRPSHLLYRANLLAMALQREWQVTAQLRDLPADPEWSINGTTAENGKRFRFKRDSLGDYELGYVDDVLDYPLANALAVSAAFPGGLGPLKLDPRAFTWGKREWNAASESARPVLVPHKFLHLYDGGVYDNLGLESLFDSGRGRPKHQCRIIVSDAGASLKRGFSWWAMNPLRFKRVVDIISEQSRSLRVRTFVHYLGQGENRGAYIYIGEPAVPEHWVDGAQPSLFPTTLSTVDDTASGAIVGHGHRLASVELGKLDLPTTAQRPA